MRGRIQSSGAELAGLCLQGSIAGPTGRGGHVDRQPCQGEAEAWLGTKSPFPAADRDDGRLGPRETQVQQSVACESSSPVRMALSGGTCVGTSTTATTK